MKHSMLFRSNPTRLILCIAIALSVLAYSAALQARVGLQSAAESSGSPEAKLPSSEVIIALTESLINSGFPSAPEDLCVQYGLKLLDLYQDRTLPAASIQRKRASVFSARVPEGKSAAHILTALKSDPRIEYIEEHSLVPVTPIAEFTEKQEDPSIASLEDLRFLQWPLELSEVSGGLSIDTKIGVVDTGFTPQGAFAYLAARIAGGYNFVTNSTDYSDKGSHGTQMVDTIVGQLGAAARANIYVLNCSPDGRRIDNGIPFSKAVDYAIENGIKVLLCSWGETGGIPSETQKKATDRAKAAGVLIIAAAGNDRSSIDDISGTWKVPQANVIRVAGSNRQDTLSSESNWGAYIEVCAPDQALLSDSTPTSFHWGVGTSMSAAWTAPLAAKLYDMHGDWRKVVDYLLATSDRREGMKRVWSAARINYRRALTGDINVPLDSLTIQKAKIKNKKKLTLSALSIPIGSPAVIAPVIRAYATDTLLGFAERNAAGFFAFSAKGKFPKGTVITLLSSQGGKAEWPE